MARRRAPGADQQRLLAAAAATGGWPWHDHLRALIYARGFKGYRHFVRTMAARGDPIGLSGLSEVLAGRRTPRKQWIARVLMGLGATVNDLMNADAERGRRLRETGRAD